MERIISFIGLMAVIGVAYLFSEKKSALNLRTVASGILLQFALGILVLWTVPGKAVFDRANAVVLKIVQFSDQGASMVFGQNFRDHFFAFKVLPSIIFFSALMAVLFHLGIMQKVVGVFSWLMSRVMGVSGAESTAASARIFVGGVEAAFTIKPYVAKMTRSEFMALCTAGMSTIAGGVMAAFVGLGINGGHLLAAQIMSATASLWIAKILLPETDEPLTKGNVKIATQSDSVNVFEAACKGAVDGVKVAAIVGAVLISFVAMTAMLNHLLSLGPNVGGMVLSIERFLGWCFKPVVFLTGVPWSEAGQLGALLGKKIFLNEFMAFLDLSQIQAALSPRSVTLATYFLCGFGNFSAVAMQIGGFSSLFPEKRHEVALFGMRALLGGTLASLSSACIAGVLT